VALGALALTTSAALAQTSDGTARQFEAGRTADFNNWLWRAQQGGPQTESEKAVQAVVDAVGRKDCPGAVAALNAGLAKGHADVTVLAGAMFEDGICVRQNWDRALSLYQRAMAAGHPTAAARLAAGSAAPAGGRDKAATLWWATQARTPMPAECAVAPGSDDPDRFVATLKGWSAERLEACFYVAAVMASVQAEAAQPGLASGFGLAGSANVMFTPAQRRVEVLGELTDDTASGRVAEGGPEEAARRRRAFTTHLQTTGERALARFAAPVAVPAEWRVLARYGWKPSR
jgi:TPR repeat protein